MRMKGLFACFGLIAIAGLATTACRRRPPPPHSSTPQPQGLGPGQGLGDNGGMQGGAAAGGVGRFGYVVIPPKNPKYNVYRPIFDQQSYEGRKLAGIFDAKLKWPRNVMMGFHDCGTVNAFYMKADHTVNMCYELVDFFQNGYASIPAEKANAAKHMVDAMIFTQLHESGHAVIGEFDLGVPGGEEEAVDDFATLILIDRSEQQIAIDGAVAMMLLNKLSGGKPHYFDEHPIGDQRFFNILCLVYASDQQKFASLVDHPLPKSRAVRCPEELHKKSKYWDEQIAAHKR